MTFLLQTVKSSVSLFFQKKWILISHAWAKQKYSQVTHNSTIGKSLTYSINQEEYFRVFLSDGNVPMDNNYAEQAIRPFTIGRKNFVMIESSNGAKTSAILCSLVETAKANMINTFEYFNLLTEIPRHMDDKTLRFIDDLSPERMSQSTQKVLIFQCVYLF
nr:transposase [uncultured Blautia sp.]